MKIKTEQRLIDTAKGWELVHFSLEVCVSVCALFLEDGVYVKRRAFFSPEQWLMWCPERHGFHIRKITVFCLLSASWPGSARGMNWRKKKKKKKNESGFSHKHLQVCAAGFCPQEPKCVYETQVDAHRDMNCTHRHTHAYTVLSFSVTHTHTHRQWKSRLSFSIVWRVTLNIYTAWQRQCPRIWVTVSSELPLRRDGAPLVALSMSRVYLCNQPSGVKHSSLSIT